MPRVVFATVVAAMVVASTVALPDLILDSVRLANSISIGTYSFSQSSCAYQEGCVTGTGNRRLLRFDTATPNIGTTDLHIGAPGSTFEYDPCHGHWHYKGYAEYKMFDINNDQVTQGRKQAFCLMDTSRWHGYTGGNPGNGGHHCGNQGISVGWQDVYYSGLDCQWIDITDVPNGVYTLQIELNAADEFGNRKVQELRYDNNIYRISVTVTGSSAGGGGQSCNVGQWSAWSSCSVACGGGVRSRSRSATGFQCPSTMEEAACNTQPCNGDFPVSQDGRCGNNHPDGAMCPGAECCSQYGWCGTSQAHCANPQLPPDGDDDDGGVPPDDDGGVPPDDDGDGSSPGGGDNGGSGSMCGGCWPGTSGFCKGSNSVCYGYFPGTTVCPGGTTACGVAQEDRDCEVDVWSAWAPCSQECGGGSQKRTRDVLIPRYGAGAPCPSPLEETRSCNAHTCPDDNPGGDIDCAVSEWGLWSDCNVACGGGEATRRREVIIAPRGAGNACPTLEEKRPCNPEACDDGDKSCSNCFPGTSGPCQSYNSVCFEAFNWNGVEQCPAGTSRCASLGSVDADDAVVFTLTVGNVTPEQYVDAAENVKVVLAKQIGVLPDTIKVGAVSGAIIEEGDEHHSRRRLHGGVAPVPGHPSTTLTVEILAPQRYGNGKAANEIASDIQKTVGDGLMARVLKDAGLPSTEFAQVQPEDVSITTSGSAGMATSGGHAAAQASAGLSTMGIALIAVCAACVGALVAVATVVSINRKRGATKSFTRVAIAPRK